MPQFHFPTWKGWLLINPIRRLFQDPKDILDDLARPGMRVLDLGCSMGYFSLPLAQMVGAQGRVICLDSDERQLKVLRRRAKKRRLLDRLDIRAVAPSGEDLNLGTDEIDLAILLQVLHYMDDPLAALKKTYAALKSGSVLLVGEPKSHLSDMDWEATVAMVSQAGFDVCDRKVRYNLRMLEAERH